MKNKTALVIGAAGFVGPYLVKNLRAHKYKVIPTKLKSQKVTDKTFVNLDILNKQNIIDVLKKYKPNYIVHLAAQASVGISWKEPILTFNINVMGSLNLLESVKELKLKTRLLLVGTSEEYGHQTKTPIREDAPCNPNNFYALSKITQEKIGEIYCKNFGLDIVFTRSFNHIGPGQSLGFVVPDFCKQIVDIEKRLQKPVIYVGNLNVKRDFSDVRDVVDAYRLLLEKGKTCEIYNVGSGKAISINHILTILLKNSNEHIQICVDKSKMRPIDIPLIRADIKKLKLRTNFKSKYKVSTELGKVLNNFR